MRLLRNRKIHRLITISVVCVLFLGACTSPPRVPVQSRNTISVNEQTEKIGGRLITFVRSGDTLYSIAFDSGLDVADLAAWNNIEIESRLQVGQRLRLTKPLNFRPAKPAQPVVRPQVVTREPVKPSNPSVTKPARPTVSARPAPTVTARSGKVRWRWPTRGRIVRSFSLAAGQKGIDIAAARGQVVVAAAPGKVVYAGNGLKGYGNLIIIKHNDQYLSAYAHNAQMFVKEGKLVAGGEKISTVGVANDGKSVLHFEVRLQGKPVNPVKYLPKL